MGPTPRKDTISVYKLVRYYGISCFIDTLPKSQLWSWGPKPPRYDNERYIRNHSEGRAFPLSGEDPPKDHVLFKYVSGLAQQMRANPRMRIYVYDREGAYCAGLVALTLWYFLQQDEDLDPVQRMKRLGKHHVVPNRKKAFVLQIKSMCEKDKKSIHRHLLPVTKKRKK